MSDLKGLFSHVSDDWYTPKPLYDAFVDNGFFDPCPLDAWDGLFVDWGEKVFVNPPYSNIDGFVDKLGVELQSGRTRFGVFLVPSRSDSRWFRKIMGLSCGLVFITGRLKFGGSDKCAPFPSVLFICCNEPREIKTFICDRDDLIPFLGKVGVFNGEVIC